MWRIVAPTEAGAHRGRGIALVAAGLAALLAGAIAAHAQAPRVANSTIVYGDSVALTGFLPDAEEPEVVTILARPHGSTCLCPIARVTTDADGSFAYTVKPRIGTSYQVSWRGLMTANLRVDVRPRLTFAVLSAQRGIFYAKADAGRPLAGKLLYLQRRARGRWTVVKRIRLGRQQALRFQADLPVGSSALRLYMPRAQAGPGYVEGFS